MLPGHPSHPTHYVDGNATQISAGDILLYGPDRWGIHHVVLARGPMKLDQKAASVLCLGPDQEVYRCLTIESSEQIQGESTPWYAGRSFYARDTQSGAARHVGDLEDGTRAIEKIQRQTPVKVLLHPLRHNSLSLDIDCFEEAIQRCAHASKSWNFNTAITSFFSRREHLDAADYPDIMSRRALLQELRERWSKPPICTSVVIMVWQMYFEIACSKRGEDEDMVAKNILQWMPVLSDLTMPSKLLQVLTSCGWLLRGNLDL
jgi:hypothetical protein